MNTVNYLVALNQKLQTQVRYVTRMEPGVQTPDETLQAGSGSCRDSAWLLVQILRQLGMPARFVSGYLIQLKPDLKPLDGPAGADRGLHRPARLDRGLHSRRRLDRLRSDLRPVVRRGPSAGRGDAALPLRGADHRRRRCGGSRFLVRDAGQPHRRAAAGHVSVFRRRRGRRSMRSAPRSMPTSRRRTSASPWAASRPSSRSTTTSRRSGTPTRSAPPSASAPTTLIRRLRDRYAPGGFLHYSQGKWYPGEPLPRWAFALFWRKDGFPVWRDDNLIAREGRGLCARPPISPSASLRAWRRGSASIAIISFRPSRIRSSGCSRRASGRTTSTPAIPRSTIPSSAHGSCASSSGACRCRPATCCRSSRRMRRRGRAG